MSRINDLSTTQRAALTELRATGRLRVSNALAPGSTMHRSTAYVLVAEGFAEFSPGYAYVQLPGHNGLAADLARILREADYDHGYITINYGIDVLIDKLEVVARQHLDES